MHLHSTMDAGPELDAEVDRRLFGHTGHGYYGPPTDPSVAWAHHLSVRYDAPDAADAAYRAYYEARYPTPESRHGIMAPEDFGLDLCYWEDGWGPRCTPEYSQDIAAAWPVVEAMHDRGWVSIVTRDNGTGRYVEFWRLLDTGHIDSHRSENEQSIPLAICLAALATIDHVGAAASQ